MLYIIYIYTLYTLRYDKANNYLNHMKEKPNVEH